MHILISIFVFMFGTIFGSFYACIGYRIPNKISTYKPGSFCINCKKTLKWYMNIPLFSYIFLGGKCSYCKRKISISYFCSELGTGILFLFAYFMFGLSYNFLISIILSSVFVIVTITDFKYYYISDTILLLGVILISFLNILGSGLAIFTYKLISGVAMFTSMYLIKIIGDKIFKKESLGGGDIKLMGFVGISVGLIPSLFVLIISSFLGLFYSIFNKNSEGILPFGPFILFATLIIWYLNFDLAFAF